VISVAVARGGCRQALIGRGYPLSSLEHDAISWNRHARACRGRIHVFSSKQNKDVDGRNKSGHDERVFLSEHIML
jgi:hypothetical protein